MVMKGNRLRVGINAHLLSGEAGYRRAGIHHYIYQVLRHLPPEVAEYVVFTRQPQLLADVAGMETAVTRWPTEKRTVRIAWEQLAWPWQAVGKRVDLLHSMAFVTPVLSFHPTVVTVYDLSFEYFPDRFPARQRWYLHTQTKRSCQQAARVITISESSRQDVSTLYGIPLHRIDVIYPGLDAAYKPASAAKVAAFRRENGLPEKFILHVGTLQPRKNIPALIEAFARIPDEDVHLVLVGGKGWLFDEIFEQVVALGLKERVHFPGYVADEALPLWYASASVFVFPSVYEGFGMPVVEAMACGTPVVASQVSSIPEAGGDAALYFRPDDVEELAAQLTAVLSQPDLAASLREKGLAQCRHFFWKTAGRQTAETYQKAIRT